MSSTHRSPALLVWPGHLFFHGALDSPSQHAGHGPITPRFFHPTRPGSGPVSCSPFHDKRLPCRRLSAMLRKPVLFCILVYTAGL